MWPWAVPLMKRLVSREGSRTTTRKYFANFSLLRKELIWYKNWSWQLKTGANFERELEGALLINLFLKLSYYTYFLYSHFCLTLKNSFTTCLFYVSSANTSCKGLTNCNHLFTVCWNETILAVYRILFVRQIKIKAKKRRQMNMFWNPIRCHAFAEFSQNQSKLQKLGSRLVSLSLFLGQMDITRTIIVTYHKKCVRVLISESLYAPIYLMKTKNNNIQFMIGYQQFL